MAQQQQPSCCTQLAIASVPMQQWSQTYRPEEAFVRGTIFPQLDMPFTGMNNIEARGDMQ